MKANELRIGNLVYAETGLPSLEVHTVMAVDIPDIDSGRAKVEPIPLTEEWLLKFGFSPIGTSSNTEYFTLDDFQIDFGNGDAPFVNMNSGVGIKHVHQLQNLYFALTNEELEVQS